MERTRAQIANRFSLSQQVRSHILAKIATGELAPGQQVVEARIAEELHVSTIPIREAIRDLVARRVLEYVVHRGAWVRQVSVSETVDALRVKAVLEALAADLAGPRLREIAPILEGFVPPILESVRRHDFVEFQNQNQLFHRAIVEASGNQILLSLWDSLTFEVRTRFIMDYLKAVDPNILAREHASILAAIEEQDTARVAALLKSHADHLVEYLLKQMTEDEAGGGHPG
jgi:DNA-binding GntR family transcriptional regulator